MPAARRALEDDAGSRSGVEARFHSAVFFDGKSEAVVVDQKNLRVVTAVRRFSKTIIFALPSTAQEIVYLRADSGTAQMRSETLRSSRPG